MAISVLEALKLKEGVIKEHLDFLVNDTDNKINDIMKYSGITPICLTIEYGWFSVVHKINFNHATKLAFIDLYEKAGWYIHSDRHDSNEFAWYLIEKFRKNPIYRTFLFFSKKDLEKHIEYSSPEHCMKLK